MDARQRRMWVLPAPDGSVEKHDRYEIGIFYALGQAFQVITRPIRALFDSLGRKPQYFKSQKVDGIFISARKTSKDT